MSRYVMYGPTRADGTKDVAFETDDILTAIEMNLRGASTMYDNDVEMPKPELTEREIEDNLSRGAVKSRMWEETYGMKNFAESITTLDEYYADGQIWNIDGTPKFY